MKRTLAPASRSSHTSISTAGDALPDSGTGFRMPLTIIEPAEKSLKSLEQDIVESNSTTTVLLVLSAVVLLLGALWVIAVWRRSEQSH